MVQGYSLAVGTVTASDADVPGALVTFSIIGGPDQSKFILTTGGFLTFVSPPSFSTPTDANGDNIYVITVQANGAGPQTATQTVSVIGTCRTDRLWRRAGFGPRHAAGQLPDVLTDNGPRHTIVAGCGWGRQSTATAAAAERCRQCGRCERRAARR